MKTEERPLEKPKLRGYFHQEAFFFFLGAGVLLIAHARPGMARLACSIYVLSLVTLFGLSACYHRFHWSPDMRRMMKRIDHSAIFVLIAGTITPLALIAVPSSEAVRLLSLVWIVAGIGILQSVIWSDAPKWMSAMIYLAAGWMILRYIPILDQSIGADGVSLLVAGGVLYSVGALFYALKSPNLFPHTFGYHEVFHVFTIGASAFHFVAIYNLSG